MSLPICNPVISTCGAFMGHHGPHSGEKFESPDAHMLNRGCTLFISDLFHFVFSAIFKCIFMCFGAFVV